MPTTQTGHAHVQVAAAALLAVTPLQEPLAPHAHEHGGQVAPGAHTGQSQVHVLPLLASASGAGFEQSHSTGGQSAFTGQAIGCTHEHPPPEASRAWQ